MTELSRFQYDVLAVLRAFDAEGREPIGQEVRAALEAELGDDVDHGRLYTNMDELAELGYVDKSFYTGRSKNYEITNDGERAFYRRVTGLRDRASGLDEETLEAVA